MATNQYIEADVAACETDEVESLQSKDLKIGSRSKKDYLFLAQILLLFIVVIAAVVNISIGNDKQEIWTILLSTGVGVLLPNPKISKCKSLMTSRSDIIQPPAAAP